MRVVSLFSGAGGLDLGFVRAGHRVVWANDNNVDSVSTYKRNIGNHIVLGDIREISTNQIPECDIVIGGFPCQGFSIANMDRGSDDPRNKLYRFFLSVLRAKKPKYFLAENVRGILSLEKGAVFRRILKDFSSCGYDVSHELLNAADYGVPQSRYRVFILGRRSDVEQRINFPPAPSHFNGNDFARIPWVTVGKALKGIPEPSSKHNLLNHVCSKYKLKHTGYINHRTMDPNKPAPTVTARGDGKGGAMINHHPNNKRRLSVRETAIIQSFPLNYEFMGNMTSCYTQVGNAVPPLLAEAIASQFPIRFPAAAKKKGVE